MKKTSFIMLTLAIAFIIGAAIFAATAWALGTDKATSLPGGAFTCGITVPVAFHKAWLIPFGILGGLSGHFFMVWVVN